MSLRSIAEGENLDQSQIISLALPIASHNVPRLSEASKMLRRLEKGLNTAKLKQSDSSLSTVFPADPRTPQADNTQFGGLQSSDAYGSTGNLFRAKSTNCNSKHVIIDGYAASSVSSRTVDPEEEEDGERSDEKFPAKLIRRENSFFRTILNPEHKSPMLHVPRNPYLPQSLRPAPLPIGYNDPITAGLINENKAKILFDAIFLRLNPFINLFDPALHSVAYVRSKCPLLFTTLIMAGCKFFEPSLYKECLRLANDLAVRAFAEGWKRVEVIQAFSCLTYWREQEDNVSVFWARLNLLKLNFIEADMDVYWICECFRVRQSRIIV